MIEKRPGLAPFKKVCIYLGGLVVSSYSSPSSTPTEAFSFSARFRLKRTKIKKEAGLAHF